MVIFFKNGFANNDFFAESTSNWFPKSKIEIAKKKLDGYNCAHLTTLELRDSVHAKDQFYFKSLEQIVAGDPKFNIRANVKEKCSSTKEQVDCLVDQATDPNILGRTYTGWAPWI
jgi:DNA-dependent protein kinase catalytic subunit